MNRLTSGLLDTVVIFASVCDVTKRRQKGRGVIAAVFTGYRRVVVEIEAAETVSTQRSSVAMSNRGRGGSRVRSQV